LPHAITFEKISRSFGGYTAVDGIDLEIGAGKFVSVVGPSGCGKSTLLNLAAGLIAPTKGTVSIFGERLTGLNRRGAYMFQQDALLPWNCRCPEGSFVGPFFMPDRQLFQKWAMRLAALFAAVWAVVRACVQSITNDEADTYFWFVRSGDVWHPFPNNHILNTLLMWIATHAFGTSTLTVRLPALLGAILYISVCYFLCRSMTDRFNLQFPVFICLVYNPFVFDYLVAARGYSLADAFLLAAIAVPFFHRVKGRLSLVKCCALASLALGLSFTSNFSFAFVDLAALLAIVTWAVRRREANSILRVIGFCIFPGLFTVILMCGYPLAHWPKGELWYGARSLGEMTRSLVDASFYRPNPQFLAPELYDLMVFLKPIMLPVLGGFCVLQLIVTAVDGSWVQEVQARWLGRFAAALAGIAALSVVLSWLAFRFAKLPLPLARTGIFLVPLCTLIAGGIAAGPTRSVVSQWLRQAITAVFLCLACYFLLCFRLNYFKEYENCADMKDVYSVLARLNHTYGVTDVAENGFYINSLNFYRVLSQRETFPEFRLTDQMPVGKSIYVLQSSYYQKFIEENRLVVVYRGKLTEVVVAVDPDGPIPPTMIER
jgi:energy-coupling factor transporter ATP-binding protein EcfA2